MATILKTDGKRTEVSPKNGKKFTLEELQEIVGGYIEQLMLPTGRSLIVNEDGRLYHLPVNMQATHLYGYEILVGDVLMCDEDEIE